MITALAGGVGAARFLQGLVRVISPEEITIIVNTGDDIELYGLRISPDLDIITYTLTGIIDEEKGWGIKGDNFHCLHNLAAFGCETWFKIGDKDFATHIYRTRRLKEGVNLSEVTKEICNSLGVRAHVIPMSNDFVQTMITTANDVMNFQEYLVKRGMHDPVHDVKFKNIKQAKPAPQVIDSILTSKKIIICPSNPIVSIGPIISLKGVKDALIKTNAKIVGISPIIQGAPIKGPADKLLKGLHFEVSSFSVAKIYRQFLDAFIIDYKDEYEKTRINDLGINPIIENTLMKTLDDKIHLAQVALDI